MKASHQLPTPRRKKRKLARRLLALVLTLGALPALAQHGRHRAALPPALPPSPTDTVRQVVELPAATIDSLAVEPLEEPAVDSARLVWLQTPATLSDLVGDRLGCIETAAPHQFNAAVLAYVRLFTERQRNYTQHVLEREQFYFPIFERYLAQYNLPAELKYLSVVESALIPTAKSPVGAVGLWQFMPPTASDLRLKRDEWVDERMQPEKATEAACKHLRYLYGVFHDWELVLAAYNWGAGNVQRVIRKTGKRNFWDLYSHMPAETRNYVPTFTAIMYAMKYAPEHSLNDPSLRYQHYEPLDTLGVRGQALDLRRLSRALGYSDSLAMNRYNPELRHGALPAGYRPYVLRYPSTAREHLGDVDRATLLAYCQPSSDLPQPLAILPPHLEGVAPWPTQVALASTHAGAESTAAPHFRRLRYTVRRGQTLADIAEKYEVSPAQLRKWNELSKGQSLKPGRQLVVFVPLPAPTVPEPSVLRPIPALAAVPHRAMAVDSAAQALAAANQRYAREAQAVAAREAAQAQALLRAQRQQAARIAAEQRQAIFRAAALAKANKAATEALARTTPAPTPLGATEPVLADAADAAIDSAATVAPTPRRSRNRAVQVAAAQPRELAREDLPTPKPTAAPRPEIYTVRAGDNLSNLAQEWGLSVSQLKAWNSLSNGTVLAGQRLRLSPVAESTASLAITKPTPHPKPDAPSLRLGTHTVQAGDTLYNISRRFKVSVEELRRLNHLTSDEVKLGQKLVVRS
ncbi:LysM peptidoglycan-binding domain-containing protein [Hymenobacter sp. HMF4947]|uniref:LysM peptidoglycan-binding domain-containing protein n=1 Tax=Hymenobacter ginkgonis TaxID=2682976 RepID=A0A7K1TM23_9BACT|nr:lytic transglycosylase domain-containing protein [Hymenobacter ginkgonis]MVN79171.1 LysM peptidoglycan-binding domain-containing protein [Hymenobacter ginkgonis]